MAGNRRFWLLGCNHQPDGGGADMKPSWKIRRRYIFAAFTLGSLMLLSGSVAVLMNNDSATSDLITGGVALVTLITTSYCFAAVWEDKSMKESQDG